LRVNVKGGVLRLSGGVAIPLQGGGVIINIGSTAVCGRGRGLSAYNATKACGP